VQIAFPSPASIAAERQDGVAGTASYPPGAGDALRGKADAPAGATPMESLSAVWLPLDAAARRLRLPRVVLEGAKRRDPAHVVDAGALPALMRALDAVVPCRASADAARPDRAFLVTWLRLAKINLEWQSRACAGGAALDAAGGEGALGPVEELLRAIVLRKGAWAALGADEGVHAMALEAFSAGVALFYRDSQLLCARLDALLAEVCAGTANDAARELCARLLSQATQDDFLARLLLQSERPAVGAAEESAVAGEGGRDAMPVLIERMVSLLFALAWEARSPGTPLDLDAAGRAASRMVETSAQWTWTRFSEGEMATEEGGCVITKTTRNSFDYAVALAGEGFSSGVHVWELRVDRVQRMSVGVCPGSVDLNSSATFREAWMWCHNGEMGGPGQQESHIGRFISGDVLQLRLDMLEGTLSFSHNGTRRGTLRGLRGCAVFPFVCFDYDYEKATLLRRWQERTVVDPLGSEHIPLVCGRIVYRAMRMLAAILERPALPPPVAQRAAGQLVVSAMKHIAARFQPLAAGPALDSASLQQLIAVLDRPAQARPALPALRLACGPLLVHLGLSWGLGAPRTLWNNFPQDFPVSLSGFARTLQRRTTIFSRGCRRRARRRACFAPRRAAAADRVTRGSAAQ
jgi:hypothetical protein